MEEKKEQTDLTLFWCLFVYYHEIITSCLFTSHSPWPAAALGHLALKTAQMDGFIYVFISLSTSHAKQNAHKTYMYDFCLLNQCQPWTSDGGGGGGISILPCTIKPVVLCQVTMKPSCLCFQIENLFCFMVSILFVLEPGNLFSFICIYFPMKGIKIENSWRQQ